MFVESIDMNSKQHKDVQNFAEIIYVIKHALHKVILAFTYFCQTFLSK